MNMIFRHFGSYWYLLLIFLFFNSCQDKNREKPGIADLSVSSRPNIILIVVDDMRWDEYSAGDILILIHLI